jgi:hypothetical protein
MITQDWLLEGRAVLIALMDAQAETQAETGDWISPFFTILFSPRETIRKIVDTDPTRDVVGLAWIAGAVSALDSRMQLANLKLPEGYPQVPLPESGPIGAAVTSFIVGLMTIAMIYVLGRLYRWSGARLGGTANSVQVRSALAWGYLPALYAAIVEITVFIVAGDAEGGNRGILLLGQLIALVLFFWSGVVSMKCLGEVHGFSAWRAFCATLLGSLALIGIFLGIILGFSVVGLIIAMLHRVAS